MLRDVHQSWLGLQALVRIRAAGYHHKRALSHGKSVKRTTRVAFALLMSVCYIYYISCKTCRHRFRSMQWGLTYTRIELDRITERKGRAKAVTEEIEDAHVV